MSQIGKPIKKVTIQPNKEIPVPPKTTPVPEPVKEPVEVPA